MISSINKHIRSLLRRIVFGSAATPALYLSLLKKKGIRIGEGTIFFDPINTVVDIQNPKLLTIGKNVRVTSGVTILTHDFSWSVVAGVYGDCIGGVAPVDIGDNVFIGTQSTILMGSKIGDNVIIGANSVVSGILDSNSVYAGNPAKKLMTLDEFYQKRKMNEKQRIQTVISKIDLSNMDEAWRYLREYSCLFDEAPNEMKKQIMVDSGYYDKCLKYFDRKHEVILYSIKDFLD